MLKPLVVALPMSLFAASCVLPVDACGPSSGVVAAVIDGDTIELESGERVRYLLVDTPENTSSTECFGEEATAFNRQLVQGKELKLSYDIECKDRFGRTLAYVEVQDRAVNELLVERGFGCVLQIPPNGTERVSEFRRLESTARAEQRGLWGNCEDLPCGQ